MSLLPILLTFAARGRYVARAPRFSFPIAPFLSDFASLLPAPPVLSRRRPTTYSQAADPPEARHFLSFKASALHCFLFPPPLAVCRHRKLFPVPPASARTLAAAYTPKCPLVFLPHLPALFPPARMRARCAHNNYCACACCTCARTLFRRGYFQRTCIMRTHIIERARV